MCLFSAALALLAWGLGSRALAQVAGPAAKATSRPADEAPATPKSHPHSPSIWNVDQMMQDAVGQIARRYNLNKQQEEYTRLVLVKRVRDFLRVYEADIRELLQESINMRVGLKKTTDESLQKWADRALPIYSAAMTAIREGNEEWREILTDEQKKIHDDDLATMDTSFKTVTAMLDRWKKGEIHDYERVAQGAQQRQDSRLVGGQQASTASRISRNPPLFDGVRPEDQWIRYLELFRRTYKLTDKQSTSGTAIHRDSLAQAVSYRVSRKQDFDDVEAKLLAGGFGDKSGPQRQAEIIERRTRLEDPIHTLFVVMVYRLNALLTEDQKAAATADEKMTLHNMALQLAGSARDKLGKFDAAQIPTTAAASQPTGSQPATRPAAFPATRPAQTLSPQRAPTPAEVKQPEKKAPPQSADPAATEKPDSPAKDPPPDKPSR